MSSRSRSVIRLLPRRLAIWGEPVSFAYFIADRLEPLKRILVRFMRIQRFCERVHVARVRAAVAVGEGDKMVEAQICFTPRQRAAMIKSGKQRTWVTSPSAAIR